MESEILDRLPKWVKDLNKYAPASVDLGLIVSYGIKAGKMEKSYWPMFWGIFVVSLIVFILNLILPSLNAWLKKRNIEKAPRMNETEESLLDKAKLEPKDLKRKRVNLMFVLYAILTICKIILTVCIFVDGGLNSGNVK